MSRASGLILVFVLAAAGSLHADSDGTYCVGPSYIAYEIQFWTEHRHTLFLVRPTSRGAFERLEVTLPQFQVHGMQCKEKGIEILGWTGVLHIDLTERGLSVRGAETLPPAQRPDPSVDPPNLAEWSIAARDELPFEAALPWPGSYKLSITTTPTKSICKRIVKTVLLGGAKPFVLLRRAYDTECGE